MLEYKSLQKHELCATKVQSFVITQAVLFNDLGHVYVVLIECRSVHELAHFSLRLRPLPPPPSPLHSIVIPSLPDFIFLSTYSSFHLSLPVHVNYLLLPFSLPSLLQLHSFPHVRMYILHVCFVSSSSPSSITPSFTFLSSVCLYSVFTLIPH